MKGFRQQKAPMIKDNVRFLQEQVRQLQAVLQLNQAMIKKQNEIIASIQRDVTANIETTNLTQYRTLSMLEVLNVDKDKLDTIADGMRLKDYCKESDKDDIIKMLVPAEVVKEESFVIISSTTDSDTEQGIFRAKIPVARIPYPEMKDGLMGKKVGDTIDAVVGGVLHHVNIIGIRDRKEVPKEEIKNEQAQ